MDTTETCARGQSRYKTFGNDSIACCWCRCLRRDYTNIERTVVTQTLRYAYLSPEQHRTDNYAPPPRWSGATTERNNQQLVRFVRQAAGNWFVFCERVNHIGHIGQRDERQKSIFELTQARNEQPTCCVRRQQSPSAGVTTSRILHTLDNSSARVDTHPHSIYL